MKCGMLWREWHGKRGRRKKKRKKRRVRVWRIKNEVKKIVITINFKG